MIHQKKKRGSYKCSKCGQPKKGHTCSQDVRVKASSPISPESPRGPSVDDNLIKEETLKKRIEELEAQKETLKAENQQLKSWLQLVEQEHLNKNSSTIDARTSSPPQDLELKN